VPSQQNGVDAVAEACIDYEVQRRSLYSNASLRKRARCKTLPCVDPCAMASLRSAVAACVASSLAAASRQSPRRLVPAAVEGAKGEAASVCGAVHVGGACGRAAVRDGQRRDGQADVERRCVAMLPLCGRAHRRHSARLLRRVRAASIDVSVWRHEAQRG